MIAVVRRCFQACADVAQGAHSVAWREADMLALPFADAAFDAVRSSPGPAGGCGAALLEKDIL